MILLCDAPMRGLQVQYIILYRFCKRCMPGAMRFYSSELSNIINGIKTVDAGLADAQAALDALLN